MFPYVRKGAVWIHEVLYLPNPFLNLSVKKLFLPCGVAENGWILSVLLLDSFFQYTRYETLLPPRQAWERQNA